MVENYSERSFKSRVPIVEQKSSIIVMLQHQTRMIIGCWLPESVLYQALILQKLTPSNQTHYAELQSSLLMKITMCRVTGESTHKMYR